MDKPSWDRLYGTASTQSGHFTTQQAAEAGYSSQLLLKHIRAGRVVRLRRGIYRLVHFPPVDHEEMVVAWLWFEGGGVLSHQTALSLHGLSDALPKQLHLTVPAEWRRRRFRIPWRRSCPRSGRCDERWSRACERRCGFPP